MKPLARIFLLTSFMILWGGSPPICFSQSNRSNDLNDTIANIKSLYSLRDYSSFLAWFPSSMEQFTEIYGYDDKTGKKPLYDSAFEHIQYLFGDDSSKHIGDLLEKTIEITIDAQWNADAVNYLQDELLLILKKYPKQFLTILSSKTKKESASVWHFLFDGPHPHRTKKSYEEIYNLIKPQNNTQAALLKREFKILLKQETCSH